MYHKPYDKHALHEPPKIKRPTYRKGRYMKHRPQTWEDWERLED